MAAYYIKGAAHAPRLQTPWSQWATRLLNLEYGVYVPSRLVDFDTLIEPNGHHLSVLFTTPDSSRGSPYHYEALLRLPDTDTQSPPCNLVTLHEPEYDVLAWSCIPTASVRSSRAHNMIVDFDKHLRRKVAGVLTTEISKTRHKRRAVQLPESNDLTDLLHDPPPSKAGDAYCMQDRRPAHWARGIQAAMETPVPPFPGPGVSVDSAWTPFCPSHTLPRSASACDASKGGPAGEGHRGQPLANTTRRCSERRANRLPPSETTTQHCATNVACCQPCSLRREDGAEIQKCCPNQFQPEYATVKPSQLVPGEHGLFAEKDIPAGTWVTAFGEVQKCPRDEVHSTVTRGWWCLGPLSKSSRLQGGGEYVKYKPPRNLATERVCHAHAVNHVCKADKVNLEMVSCSGPGAEGREDTVWVAGRTTTLVPAGTELVWQYTDNKPPFQCKCCQQGTDGNARQRRRRV